MDRRAFIRRMAQLAAATTASVAVPRALRSAAQGQFGAFPDVAKAYQLGQGKRAEKVLDVLLGGGFSPWESFYVVPEYGKKEGHYWWTYQEGPESVAEWHAKCNGGPLIEPWLTDSLGAKVYLGPMVAPLRARPDIIARMRVMVMQHTLMPHETAVPLTFTGLPLGSVGAASPGAAVQHAALAESDYKLSSPVSYALTPPIETSRITVTTGMHPTAARPIELPLRDLQHLMAVLGRDTVGNYAPEVDALAAHYAAQYKGALTPPGANIPVRAAALDDFLHATATLPTTPALASMMMGTNLMPVSGMVCGQQFFPAISKMQMQLAAHLLQAPGSKARYVSVFDNGQVDGSPGFDAHAFHVRDSFRAARQTLGALLDVVRKPGENAPHKIDLDETMIVLNSEFGRAPGKQGAHGRNHWPYGYVVAFIGGPIGTKQAGLRGAIDPAGLAVDGLTPLQQRAAMLVAMGIWPFDKETYPVGGFPGGTELGVIKWLHDDVLGQA